MATIKIKSGDQWTQIPMIGINPMPDAPSDGKTYGRKDGAWAEVTSSSGSTQELTKEAIEAVFTGNVETHSHDTVYESEEFDIWNGTSVSNLLSGTGSETDPYQVNSCADWVHFINNGMQYSSITGESGDSDNSFRYISVNKGLDFNNVEIDFTSNIEYYYPRYENIQTSRFPIVYFVIDFNGHKIRNFNTKNGNILGASMYTLLKNVKVDGSVSYDLDLIESLTTQSSTNEKTDLYISNLNGIPFVTEGSALDILFMNFYKNIDVSLKVKFLNNSSFTKIGTIYVISRTKVPSVESQLTPMLNENFQNIKTNITYSLENPNIEHLLEFNSIQNAYMLETGETVNDCTLDLTVGVNRENNTPTVSKGLSVQTLSNAILVGSGTVNNIYSLVNEGHFSHDISVQKTESELKSISFLNVLNLASDENVWDKGDDGYPSLKLKDMSVIYDGYVRQSEFESLYNNISSNTSKIETIETDIKNTIIKIEEGGNGTVTKELQPNTYYEFGVCDQLTITLASGRTGYLNQYMFEFSCNPFSSTIINNIPGVFWQNNEQLIPEAGYRYQVSIINNVASYYKVLSSYGIVTYTTTGTSENVRLIYRQQYVNKITLEDGTDVPITGTGALNYTFGDIGEHKVAIEFKKDVTDFSDCFYNCSALTNIPANLFANCPNVTDFSDCFRYCSGLTSIPENLFSTNTAVTNFAFCFSDCSGLTSIPENLFTNCTAVTDFNGCFISCSELTSIPKKLFENNTSVTNFQSCFSWCSGLTNIPENLFATNIAVTNFSQCFQNCSSLTSIPNNLFATNTKVTDFSSCFSDCSGLTGSIPANLFANCPNVTTFSGCFWNCENLTSIPENLFANNTAVTNFSSCFGGCTGLTGSIPENLFKYNTAVTTFYSCFYHCLSLTGSIPDNLFETNIAVTSFTQCFWSCGNLTSIPENLFANNTAVTSFSSCFAYCSGLTGNVPTDNDGTPIYYRSGEGKSGYAIVTSYDNCFLNCTGLTNYSSIPTDWR